MQSCSSSNTSHCLPQTFDPFSTSNNNVNCDIPKFRWMVIILSHAVYFSVCVVVASLSLTIVAMIEPEPDYPAYDKQQNDLKKMVSLEYECDEVTNYRCNESFITIVSDRIVGDSTYDNSGSESLDGGHHVFWSETKKDYMLQSLFWGALISSPLGGRIGETLGPRKVVANGLLVIASLNFIYPVAALTNYWFAFTIRVTQGIVQGIVVPSLWSVVSRWSIDSEKTLSNAVVQGGQAMANIVVHPFVGYLISNEQSTTANWPSVFYYIGLLNLIVLCFWCFTVWDYPETHPNITQEELDYIILNRSLKSGVSTKVPWNRILSSPPVIAYLSVAFTYGWLLSAVSTQMPSFYKEILNLNFETNGLVNALPWIVSIIISITGGFTTDYVCRNSFASLITTRKCLAFIGLGSGVIGIMAITLYGWSNETIISFVILSKGLATLNIAGPGTSHLDISPSYAGTLGGIYNLCYNLSALIMNQSVVSIVGNNPTKKKWFSFFHLTSGINLIGLILFLIMGSAEVQNWDPSYEPSPVNFRTPLNTHYLTQNNMNTFN